MSQTTPIHVNAYRGEHGAPVEGALFQTRLGSLSFGSLAAAKTYATSPNNPHDTPIAPRILSVTLEIRNPVINTPDDPFIEFSVIEQALGRERAKTIALALAEAIAHTNNWHEIAEAEGFDFVNLTEDLRTFLERHEDALDRLYVEAFWVFDNAEWVEWFVSAGYDGACHCGSGETFDEAEYKVFLPERVKVKSVQVPKDPRVAAVAPSFSFD